MAITIDPSTFNDTRPVNMLTLQTKEPVRAWWKEASVYQIYPASFKDSNGDGIGDIPGIHSKVDYIKSLGVDLVWLCPVYKSPQVDMGYDISDYRQIDPQYGDVADVEELIAALHARGIKFLMDLVVNHTSDKHEWFQSALLSKDSAYRDFYIWKQPKYDSHGKRHPPNNWRSYFGGSAWEYDSKSNEYYLHLFAKEQPDLNWENPKVREAVHDIMRFWLDKGVDGFRMDVINFISKEPGFPNAKVTDPSSAYQFGDEFYAAGPRLHEYLKELGRITKEYDAFTVGEMPGVSDVQEIIKAVGFDEEELNMIFHFEIADIDHGNHGRFSPNEWKISELKRLVNKWQTFMIDNNGWNALYLENHDQSRSVSRYASDDPQHHSYAAKMLATFLALQSGTVFIYQGQEIGMTNIPKSWPISEYRDIECLNYWKEVQTHFSTDDHEFRKVAKEQYQMKSRDNARLPVQWDASQHAGFTTGKPWMRVNDNYETINVEAQVGIAGSIFSHWQALLLLRKHHRDIFVYGDFRLLATEDEDVFAYERNFGEQKALVVCNMRERIVDFELPKERWGGVSDPLLSNYRDHVRHGGVVTLRPFEALVFI